MASTDKTAFGNQCPSCNGKVEDELADIPQPVCSDCGFVIGSKTPRELDTNGADEQSGVDSWKEYYSISNATEEQVASAFELLEQIDDELLLSTEIKRQTAEVYKSFAIKNLTDGRSTRSVLGVSVCLGSRNAGVSRPTDRVAQALEVDTDSLRRLIRVIQRDQDQEYQTASPTSYIPFLCRDKNLDDEIEHEAIHLIGRYAESGQISGKSPSGIAGAGVYLVAGGAVTQRGIADVVGVTKETIRVRVSEIRGLLL